MLLGQGDFLLDFCGSAPLVGASFADKVLHVNSPDRTFL